MGDKFYKGQIRFYNLWDWWISEFTQEERDIMIDKHQFFGFGVSLDLNGKVEDEKLNYLEEESGERSTSVVVLLYALSFCFKKGTESYNKINNKTKEIFKNATPNIEIDFERLDNDKYYSAWFFNRFVFFHDIEHNKKHTPIFTHALWNPVEDNLSPRECKILHNQVFKMDSPKFKAICLDHWRNVRYGCRCGLITMTDDEAEEFKRDNPPFQKW